MSFADLDDVVLDMAGEESTLAECSRLEACFSEPARVLTLRMLTLGGVSQLARLIKSSPIANVSTLRLERCAAGDVGVTLLSSALKENFTLTSLGLEGSGLTAGGCLGLAQLLAANSTLTELKLGHNSIADEGACTIASGLGANCGLLLLGLYGCGIGSAGAGAILGAIGRNGVLETLILDGNSAVSEEDMVRALQLGQANMKNTMILEVTLRRKAEDFIAKMSTARDPGRGALKAAFRRCALSSGIDADAGGGAEERKRSRLVSDVAGLPATEFALNNRRSSSALSPSPPSGGRAAALSRASEDTGRSPAGSSAGDATAASLFTVACEALRLWGDPGLLHVLLHHTMHRPIFLGMVTASEPGGELSRCIEASPIPFPLNLASLSLREPPIVTASPKISRLDLSNNLIDDLDDAFGAGKGPSSVVLLGNPLRGIPSFLRGDSRDVIAYVGDRSLMSFAATPGDAWCPSDLFRNSRIAVVGPRLGGKSSVIACLGEWAAGVEPALAKGGWGGVFGRRKVAPRPPDLEGVQGPSRTSLLLDPSTASDIRFSASFFDPGSVGTSEAEFCAWHLARYSVFLFVCNIHHALIPGPDPLQLGRWLSVINRVSPDARVVLVGTRVGDLKKSGEVYARLNAIEAQFIRHNKAARSSAILSGVLGVDCAARRVLIQLPRPPPPKVKYPSGGIANLAAHIKVTCEQAARAAEPYGALFTRVPRPYINLARGLVSAGASIPAVLSIEELGKRVPEAGEANFFGCLERALSFLHWAGPVDLVGSDVLLNADLLLELLDMLHGFQSAMGENDYVVVMMARSRRDLDPEFFSRLAGTDPARMSAKGLFSMETLALVARWCLPHCLDDSQLARTTEVFVSALEQRGLAVLTTTPAGRFVLIPTLAPRADKAPWPSAPFAEVPQLCFHLMEHLEALCALSATRLAADLFAAHYATLSTEVCDGGLTVYGLKEPALSPIYFADAAPLATIAFTAFGTLRLALSREALKVSGGLGSAHRSILSGLSALNTRAPIKDFVVCQCGQTFPVIDVKDGLECPCAAHIKF
jgi:hypothetical protein